MAKKGATSPSANSSAAGEIEVAAKPYTVLARRYRSRDFGEVVGQEPIARTLQNAISTGRTAHAYLFCGTRGVGKTSMARIFARALNRDSALSQSEAIGDAILRGEDLDVIEIDGASNRGIDDARDLIAGAGLAPTRGKYRIYIIDEVHMLTTPAFNALLKTMEEPPSHVKFILCTTEPHKVPQTIQSRCQRFDFRNIPTKQIAGHLGAVAKGEGIEVTEDVLLSVARLANGSMRDGLSLLDRLLAAATGKVDGAVLEQVFGLPDDEILLDIVEACVSERVADALLHGARLLERGSGVEQALELLAERFRWILVASAAGTESDLLEVAASMRDRVARIAGQTDAAFCAHAIALCDATARNARGSSAPRALYDACVARLALSSRFASGAALLAGGGGADSKKAGNPAAPRATGTARADGSVGTGPGVTISSIAIPSVTSPAAMIAAVETKPASSTPPPRDSASRSPGASVADTRPVPRPTPNPAAAASAVPAKPASAPAAPAPASTMAELRARLEQVAERSPRDRALFEQIEVLDFTGDSARVAVVDGGSGQYLATNPDPIRTLLSRAAGRPLRLTLDTSRLRNAADAPRPTQVDDPSIRNDPLVRKAAELLDATVIAVTPRFIGDDAKVDDADGAGADQGDPAEAKTGDEAPPADEPGVFGGFGFDGPDESFE
jgi:DNA polymerase-3 subunit gamma/tau